MTKVYSSNTLLKYIAYPGAILKYIAYPGAILKYIAYPGAIFGNTLLDTFEALNSFYSYIYLRRPSDFDFL